MEVGRQFAGKTFVCMIGGEKPVRIDADGFGAFSVQGGRCSVYIPQPTLSSLFYRICQQIRRFLTLRLF